MDDKTYVQLQWQSVCADLGINPRDEWVLDEWWEIEKAYTGPDRHYHDIGHIAYVLREIDRHRALVGDLRALKYAAIRHDEVYLAYPRPKGLATIEALSACVADDALLSLNELKIPVPRVTMEFRQRVAGIINVTHHSPAFPPQSQDEKLMADIDWSPMGAPWTEFLRNRKKIRAEYRAYTDKEFVVGRAAFLSALTSRASYYHLDAFKAKYDAQSKLNIRKDLELCALPWEEQVEVMDAA